MNNKRACKTGKKIYKDREQAKRAKGNVRVGLKQGLLADTGKVPTREYQCPTCGGWHLSSQREGR